jgi:hypothetical protein
VGVDEAGADDHPVRIYSGIGLQLNGASDDRNATFADVDIRLVPGISSAIDDLSVLY